MLRKVFVLVWAYYDGSGHGVARAYVNEARARRDLVLLGVHSDGKHWQILECDLEEESHD